MVLVATFPLEPGDEEEEEKEEAEEEESVDECEESDDDRVRGPHGDIAGKAEE